MARKHWIRLGFESPWREITKREFEAFRNSLGFPDHFSFTRGTIRGRITDGALSEAKMKERPSN